jgi:DNA-binding CsgD family transcriptional regulator
MNEVEPLTRRERDVLALVARGLTNRQIAEALIISKATVQNHLRHAFDKLGATSRTQAVLKANLLVHNRQAQPYPEAQTEKRAHERPAGFVDHPLRSEL